MDASGRDADDCGSSSQKQPSPDKNQQKCNNEDVSEEDNEEQLGTAFQTLRLKEERCFIRLGTSPHDDDDDDDDGSSGVDDDDELLSSEHYDPRKPFHRWKSSLTQEESELENEEYNPETCLRQTVSLPPASTLVSAMKGAREKSGLPPREPRSVSWAPDVYDPRPNSLTYIPKKKILTRQQIKTNKKYGKGKQKGKNARSEGGGSGSRPKSQGSRNKSSAQKKFDHDDDDDEEEDDDLQSPQSFRGGGSSYRGKNRGKKGKNRGNTRCFAYSEAD